MEHTRGAIIDYIQRAIYARTGDDLERARHAFRFLTPEAMQEEYGQSGKTCQQVLAEYERERELATAAMSWILGRP